MKRRNWSIFDDAGRDARVGWARREAPSMTSFFRRRRADPGPPSEPEQPVSTGITCSAPGCSNDTAVPCGYRDRRGRLCRATFCPDHGVTIGGVFYCRRHAGTVQAIGELAADPNGLPDLEDRTPSLVNWISRELDHHIRGLLEGAAREGETVVVDESGALSATTPASCAGSGAGGSSRARVSCSR